MKLSARLLAQLGVIGAAGAILGGLVAIAIHHLAALAELHLSLEDHTNE